MEVNINAWLALLRQLSPKQASFKHLYEAKRQHLSNPDPLNWIGRKFVQKSLSFAKQQTFSRRVLILSNDLPLRYKTTGPCF